jgi:hypothetical protein
MAIYQPCRVNGTGLGNYKVVINVANGRCLTLRYCPMISLKKTTKFSVMTASLVSNIRT